MDNIELLLSELEGEMLEGKKTLFYVDQLMKDAKEKEQRMIAETNIMKKASQEADTLRKEADAYKQRTMYQVNRLVDEHLVSIENTVAAVLDYIRNAREELEGDMFKNKGQR